MAILTTTGKQWIVDKMRGAVATTQSWVHWGTGGATGELVSQTALVTPASEARVQGPITSPSAGLHRVVATLTCAGSSKTISEVGLFDANANGVMLIRHVFAGVPLEVGDRLEFTLDYTQT